MHSDLLGDSSGRCWTLCLFVFSLELPIDYWWVCDRSFATAVYNARVIPLGFSRTFQAFRLRPAVRLNVLFPLTVSESQLFQRLVHTGNAMN